MKGNYNLSYKANQDIAAIYEFGIEKFGFKPAEKYIKELEENFTILVNNPNFGRKSNFLIKNLFRYRFKAHVIFFVLSNNDIFIIRVLGSRMDFIRHL